MLNPPLRVPLGSLAVDRIAKKLRQWEQNLEDIEALARSADFEC